MLVISRRIREYIAPSLRLAIANFLNGVRISSKSTSTRAPDKSEALVLVSAIGARWNTLYPALIELDEQLQKLEEDGDV
jgi:hypothetical protein